MSKTYQKYSRYVVIKATRSLVTRAHWEKLKERQLNIIVQTVAQYKKRGRLLKMWRYIVMEDLKKSHHELWIYGEKYQNSEPRYTAKSWKKMLK